MSVGGKDHLLGERIRGWAAYPVKRKVIQALLGARGEPAFDVGSRAFVGSAAGHGSDVTTRRAEQFFVGAAHHRQDGRRLTGRRDVIFFGNNGEPRDALCYSHRLDIPEFQAEG